MSETDTVTYKSPVLTEEMIDAAMNNKFNLSKELILDDEERRNNSNSEDSSDYDCQIETIDGDSPILQDEFTSLENINKSNQIMSSEGTLVNGVQENTMIKHVSNNLPTITKLPEKSESSNEKGMLKLKPIKNLLKENVAQSYSKLETQEKKIKVFTRVNGKIQLLQNTAIRPPKRNKSTQVKSSCKVSGSSSSVDPEYYSSDGSDSDERNSEGNNLDVIDHSYIKNKIAKPNKIAANCGVGTTIMCNKNQGSSSTTNVLKGNIVKPTRVQEIKVMKKQIVNRVSSSPNMLKKQLEISNTTTTLVKEHEIIDCSDSSDSDELAKSDARIVKSRHNQVPVVPSTSGISTSSVKEIITSSNNSSNTNTSVYTRRPVVPKISYRYHTNDNKVVISDTLPNNATVISVKKNQTKSNGTVNVYKIAEAAPSRNVIIMTPDKVGSGAQPPALSAQPVIQLAGKSTYLRNVLNTIVTPSATIQKTNSGPKTSTVSLLKGSVSTASTNTIRATTGTNTVPNWEKVDRATIDGQINAKDSMEKLILSQILERVKPPYCPPAEATEIFPCLDCGDKFAIENSLTLHKQRRSISIIYWCRICSCCLNFYNRCMFLAHLRSHNQLLKNIDMTCVSIESLPPHLLGFPSLDEQNRINVHVSPPSTVTNNVSDTVSETAASNVLSPSTPCDSSKQMSATNATIVRNVNDSFNTVNKRTSVEPVGMEDSSSLTNVDNQTSANQPNTIEMDTDEISNNGKSASSSNSITKDMLRSDHIEETVSNNLSNVEKDYLKSNVNKSSDVELKMNQVKSKGKRVCPECGCQLTAKASLRKHLQNFNKPLTDKFKCDECHLILQSQCSLIMHRRIHKKMTPFRCPDCALEFTIFDRFLMHLKFTCCHLTKVVRYVCSLCSSMQITSALLEQHLMTRHVRSVFKCGGCPVAFVNAKGVEKHREKEHPDSSVMVQSYQQCKLCPEKLIPKKKFLTHMKTHLNDDKIRIYAFQCPSCKFTFFHRTELIYHRMKCESKAGIIKSVLDYTPTTDNGTEESCISANKSADEQEIAVLPSRKQRVMNDEGLEVHEEEKDPLSLEDFEAEVLQEPSVQTCVVCKTEKVLILPGKNESSQSLCCKKCVSPCGVPALKGKFSAAQLIKKYKCNLCPSSDYMSQRSTFVHFKNFHKDIEEQGGKEWLTINNNTTVITIKKSNTVSTAETIKEKYKVKRPFSAVTSALKTENAQSETENDRNTIYANPEKKRPKRWVKLKEKKPEDIPQSDESNTVNEDESSKFSCSKCKFTCADKEELRQHVVSHRTDPNALQCLECGECFIVLPSLEKHLIINHGISDVNKYISDQKLSKSVTEDDLFNDDESINLCKVCSEVFHSKSALDKHFRSHGMAFLFKKK